MRTTSLSQIQLDEELRRRGRSDPMMMGRVNKERLGQYLGGIQRKENTEDRFSAALREETLAGPPDARVIAGAATISMPAASLHPENIAVPLQTGPSPEQSKVAATTTSFTTP